MTDTAARPTRGGLDEVRALARREYGVDGELTELGSQQDRNVLVRGVDGAGMLVKIFHPTVDAFAVDLHIAASRSPALRRTADLPEVLTTVDGARHRRRSSAPTGRSLASRVSRSSTGNRCRHHRCRRRPGRGTG